MIQKRPEMKDSDINDESRNIYNDESRNIYKGALAIAGFDWPRVLFLGAQGDVSPQNICNFSA